MEWFFDYSWVFISLLLIGSLGALIYMRRHHVQKSGANSIMVVKLISEILIGVVAIVCFFMLMLDYLSYLFVLM